ncbi:hypothetical protein FNU76_07400 [Chitinimonas arctica]|uniref:protein adenylyltransferase n=1 Tax=Chitinimonas arctica TaxID=2594795 RepID=A0A516SDG9_9NEIS|nr:Fic family protein [Chitinimonas arctica]QDQ26196.1 hypothetical protein FNU76_07400 [Chitinimonas arctica]
MNEDPHYYIEGYSIDDDPYSQTNGVLVNLHGLTTTKDLELIEAEYSALAIEEILKREPPSKFDIATLKSIHREIFMDVYPWAGEFRKVDIAKGDTCFEGNENIGEKLRLLFEDCQSRNYYLGLTLPEFSQAVAVFLVELNRIHPFREGNGRAQRVLLSLLALNAGFTIAWEGVSDGAMKQACIDGLAGNFSTMTRLLKVYLETIAP